MRSRTRSTRSARSASISRDGRSRQITKPQFTRVHETLEREAGMVETLIHDLALGVEDAMLRHGKGIIERQFLQERMANAAIDIYPRDGGALAHDVGDRPPGRRGSREGPPRLRARLHSRWRIVARAGSIRGLRKHQDARLKAIAEASLESGNLGPDLG